MRAGGYSVDKLASYRLFPDWSPLAVAAPLEVGDDVTDLGYLLKGLAGKLLHWPQV